MVDGDALEMRFGETQRGFESPPLRFSLFCKHFNYLSLNLSGLIGLRIGLSYITIVKA